MISRTSMPAEFAGYSLHFALGVRKHRAILSRFLHLIG
jgi:hypothetical protein